VTFVVEISNVTFKDLKHHFIYLGAGELDTMRQIFLQQGKEKFLSGSSGGPVTWKQSTPPPISSQSQTDTTSWPSSST